LALVTERSSIYPRTVGEARAFLAGRASMTQATEAARLILSSYPQNINPINAKCYATQVVALLMTYPPAVVDRIARPVEGIVGKSRWIPSVAEVKAECDSFMRIPREMVQRHEAEQRHIAERGKPVELFDRPKPKQIETWKRLKFQWGNK
jgi:hypothetical protein